MKKIIIVPLLLGVSVIFYLTNHMAHAKNEIHQKSIQVIPADLILTSENKPTPDLQSLLNLLQVQYDGSLDSLVKTTQATWLRQAGKERWQVPEIYEKHQTAILNFSEKLGLMHEITPTQLSYDYAILLGATLSRVRSRLAYLAAQWKKGIRFNTIICLGSERVLDKEIEKEAYFLDQNNTDIAFRADWKFDGNFPKNEYEMMRFVLDQADIPQAMRSLPIIFINAPSTILPDGTVRRATTPDTIVQWLKAKPAPGSCLFVSSQPYVCWQDSVVRTHLPASFGFIETCGPQARSNVRNVELLDTIARMLYQEKIRRKV